MQSVCIVNIAILCTTTYQYVVVLSMTEIVSQNNFFSEKHRKEVCRTTAQWGHNHSGVLMSFEFILSTAISRDGILIV